jgi:O-antigen/teichoic acid export membrane protein
MSLAESAASGAKWSFVSVAGRRAITLLTTIVLARLLSPADFGLVAMAAVFINFIELLRDLGTGRAIVQVDAPGEDLLSSLFWLNLVLGVAAAAILIVFSPLASRLLREPRLALVLAVLSISTLCTALSVVHTNLLTRELQFRRLALVEMAGSIAGGALGIVLALGGYAVWSLVWQNIVAAITVSAGAWLASGWRPRLMFSRSSLRPIVGFSANLTGFNVFNYFARNADNLLIGRYLGAQDLGLYDLAYRIMLYPVQVVSWTLGRALFPIYARMKADPERLRVAYLKVTKAIALVTFPMTFGMAAIADRFVETVLGSAWTPAVLLLLILAPVSALQTVGATVGHIYQAMGRTDLMLRWGAGGGLLLVLSFVIGLQWGLVGVAACYAIVSYALAYHLFKIPFDLVGIPVSDLVKAVGRSLVCTAGMVVVVLFLKATLPAGLSAPAELAVLIAAAVAVYAWCTWVYNRNSAQEVLLLARRAS